MPSLKRPSEPTRIDLPARRALLAAETDVLVVGGGPAGLGAAVGAADAGARVVLAERYGFLGGNATAALVMPLMSFHTQRPSREKRGETTLLPTDHGPGDPIVAGVLKRLLERLVCTGGGTWCARPPRRASWSFRARTFCFSRRRTSASSRSTRRGSRACWA